MSETTLVESACLPFSKIPHTTRLFSDYLHDFARVRDFYSRPPQPETWATDEATRISYDGSRRQRVADILDNQNRRFGASQPTFDNIDRLRRGACVAVTGQQVGFLGGPLFAILKALTAVRIAAQATASGVDCVPVFWLASEDHDFAEVQSAVVQDADGRLHTLTIQAEHRPGAPMSDVVLSEASLAAVQEAAGLLGEPDVSAMVSEAYRSGESLSHGFARLFAALFSRFGVILLDASDPELHAVAAPVLRQAVEKAAEIDAALLERGKQLHAHGYHEQVKVSEASTLLFAFVDGVRTPIHRANGTFLIGAEKLTADELADRVSAHPESFSPNVLLRPVVQDYLLPTLAYCGGPAEVAYFAQAAVVFERLLGRVTPILPRFSATLADARAQRLLKQYGLSLPDLFHGFEQTRETIATRSLPSDLTAAFDQATALVERAINELQAPIGKLDPTLLNSAERAGSKMRYQISRLRARAAAAEVRRNEIIDRHAEALSSALFPHKDLQERVICGLSFVARFGPSILDLIYDAQDGCPEHHIINV